MCIGHHVYNTFSDTLSIFSFLTQNKLHQELERLEIPLPSIERRKLRLGQIEWTTNGFE